jgi:dihydrofolate reductase
MKHFKAIAAMSLNRVIGADNKIPWHLPEDFKWFKAMTTGHIAVMGRKTFESLPALLPNRRKLVLTHDPKRLVKNHPEIFGKFRMFHGEEKIAAQIAKPYQLGFSKFGGSNAPELILFDSLDRINPSDYPCDVFICGGAQIYEQMLPRCSDLYLTVVNREVEGDAFFPKFEDRFVQVAEMKRTPDFTIFHYRHRNLA